MNRFTHFVVSSVLSIVVLGSGLTCTDQTSPPTQPASVGSDAVYVQTGMAGDGSRAHPFGTIHDALSFTAAHSSFRLIFIATGEYPENIVIRTPVKLQGGCNPDSGWTVHDNSRSTMRGFGDTGLVCGVTILGPSGTVELSHLVIISPNAIDTSASTVGIFALSEQTVRLVQCSVVTGNGVPGRSGVDGGARPSGWPEGQPSPATGGAGGHYGMLGNPPPGPGFQGYCADGSQTGGLGANVGEPHGGDGQSGQPGTNGVPAGGLISIGVVDSQLAISTLSGTDGTPGQFGCGGGGGAGTEGFWERSGTYPGCNGGHGGDGGFPGNGGTGGSGGGSTIGIVCAYGILDLVSTHIALGDAGNGGAAGKGAAGSPGGSNGSGQCYYFLSGSAGGLGGQGGDGGYGGGGAGGWNIGIAFIQAAGYTSDNNSVIVLGRVGNGGLSDKPTQVGTNGRARLTFSI